MSLFRARKGGQWKYREEFCELLIEHMAKGYSFESFAGTILVDRSTIYNWVKDFPEFAQARAVAKSASLLHWEKVGVENVINEHHPVEGSRSVNTALYTLHMVNLFDWRTKAKGEADVNVNVSDRLAKARKRIEQKDKE